MTLPTDPNSSNVLLSEKWLDGIGVELEHPGMLIVQRLNSGCTLMKLKLEFEALLQAAENRGSDLIESSLQHTVPLQKHVQTTSKQLQSINARLSTAVKQIRNATGRLEMLERTISRLVDYQKTLSAIKSVISSILFTTRHFIDICSELKDQMEDYNDAAKYHHNPIMSYFPYSDDNVFSPENSKFAISSGKTFNLSNVEYLRIIAIEIGRSRQSVQELRNISENLLTTLLTADDETIATAASQLSASIETLEQFSECSIKIMLGMVEKSLKSGVINVSNFSKHSVTLSGDLSNLLNLLKCYYALSDKKTIPSFLTLFHDIIEKCLGSSASLDSGPEEQFKEFQKFAEKILIELESGSIRKFLDKLSTHEDSEPIISDLMSILGNQIFRTIQQHFRYIYAPVYEEPFFKVVETIVKLQDLIEFLAGPSAVAVWRGSDIPKSVSNSLCISPLVQSLANSIIEKMHNQTLNDKISPPDIDDAISNDQMKLYLATSNELVRGCLEITEKLRFFEYYPLRIRVISDLNQMYTRHLRSFIFWEKELKEFQVDSVSTWPQGITPSHAVYLISDLKALVQLFAENGKIYNSLLSNIEYPKSVITKIEHMDTHDRCQDKVKSIAEFVDQLTSISQSFLGEAIVMLDNITNELVEYVSEEVFQSCSVTFQFIKTLPSQFRMANCISPTVPSSFISFILVPLSSFVEFAVSINNQVVETILALAIEKVAMEYDKELDATVESTKRQNENLKLKFKSEMTITTNIELLKAQISLDVNEFIKLVGNIYQNGDTFKSFSKSLTCLDKWTIVNDDDK